MIKARGVGHNGQDFILLGLSHENVARLFADEPFVVRTAQPPPTGVGLTDGPDIILIAGSDEEAITAKLRAAGLVPGRTAE